MKTVWHSIALLCVRYYSVILVFSCSANMLTHGLSLLSVIVAMTFVPAMRLYDQICFLPTNKVIRVIRCRSILTMGSIISLTPLHLLVYPFISLYDFSYDFGVFCMFFSTLNQRILDIYHHAFSLSIWSCQTVSTSF